MEMPGSKPGLAEHGSALQFQSSRWGSCAWGQKDVHILEIRALLLEIKEDVEKAIFLFLVMTGICAALRNGAGLGRQGLFFSCGGRLVRGGGEPDVAGLFREREQRQWDEQVDRDSVSGKLNFLFEEAESESKEGLLREWPPPK